MMAETTSADDNFKKTLIDNVKKQVKQIMEEAVTKKFVHEDSSCVTSLCAAVEACLSQGLRRRALGLFKSSSTTALLHKLAKNFPPAEAVSRKVQEIDNAEPTRRSSSSGDSTSRPSKPPLQKKNSSGAVLTSPKYLWIRLALFEKQLAKIIDHLVQNSSKYYESDALVADPDYGSILSSLLVGPCALDYSRTKTQDHFWTDPSADELVQRHRISSGHATPPACRRPALNFRRSLHGVSSEEGHRQIPINAKDYVESLHQNNRVTLLYGKNNVLVLPKDLPQPMPGYLSLHQTPHTLTIKWTPNQLMNGYAESEVQDRSTYWDYALNVNVNEIVYVHCHQQVDNGGTVVLVGQDGVQRPPIHFPKGGHLLDFLSCLENGLLPRGQLDPPLWSQRGKGKVFPKLRRKGRAQPSTRPPSLDEADESSDYVFRIINKSTHQDFSAQDLLEPRTWTDAVGLAHSKVRAALASTSTSSTSSSKSLSLGGDAPLPPDSPRPPAVNGHTPQLTTGDSIQLVYDTMKRQIIARAFYGWLAHCRHLRTVRKHLSGLVSPNIVSADEPTDARLGISLERWKELTDTNGCVESRDEIFRLAYFGGVYHEIRREVWPYLLGHYQFGSTTEERITLDETTRKNYETTMSEWLAVEAIVRQLDKEVMAANQAKLSSESTSGGEALPPNLQHDLSNDVFEDDLPMDTDPENDDDKDKDKEKEKPIVKPAPPGARCPPNSLESGSASISNEGTDTALAAAAAAAATIAAAAATAAEVATSPAVVAAASAALSGGASSDEDQCHVNASKASSDNPEGPVPGTSSDKDSENCHGPSEPENQAQPMDGDGEATAPEQTEKTNHHEVLEMTIPMTETPPAASEGEAINREVDPDEQAEADEAADSVGSSLPNCFPAKIVMTKPSVDCVRETDDGGNNASATSSSAPNETGGSKLAPDEATDGTNQGNRSNCVSPASEGGIYSEKLLNKFGLNLHRIDKDVQRCDRNYQYFTIDNLEKLRNVICTYVWEHLDFGYMQGMCDLVAPLLVVFDDESATYACFCRLMDRMVGNFRNDGAMDKHFANMRSLIQIIESEVFELLHEDGDYTHFYFCYRWFLLDFKRELLYNDVFGTWETIWAAQHVASSHFVLFIALALVQTYRDIILSNSMDYTDMIKFFNEMAERHDAKAVLSLARDLVLQVQTTLTENK